jgi:hypothetical protein
MELKTFCKTDIENKQEVYNKLEAMLKYHEGEEGNSQEMEKITDLVKVIFGRKAESFLMKF